ncbi:MAG: hypothetical protein JSR67_05535 [Proteobacteria bacterium]|nr:hypothetical protein [Pseudomonadota bacterium]
MKRHVAALAACVCFGACSLAAWADDAPYTEGTVVNVASIRTEYGKFDEYIHYLATTWKAEQEAAKKAGFITGYRIVSVQPRGEHDPDIYLVTFYKNWAALDGARAKGDQIAREVQGSVANSNQSAVDRAKMRRVLGSWTGQELDLK